MIDFDWNPPQGQRVRLIEAGADRVFVDVVSGKRFERPGPAELLDHAWPGDRLCVTRRDRVGRSLRELLETVDALKARGIHLMSLEERLDNCDRRSEPARALEPECSPDLAFDAASVGNVATARDDRDFPSRRILETKGHPCRFTTTEGRT